MATNPSKEPIPSELPRDLKYNAGKIDELVNSADDAFSDRFGKSRLTWAGIESITKETLSQVGYVPIDSFEDGATITTPNQTLRYEATGDYYRWDGTFPKTVPVGSTPSASGGVGAGKWLSVGDGVLRSELFNPSRVNLPSKFTSSIEPDAGLRFGNTSGIPTINVKDDVGQRLLLNKNVSNADDFAVLQINRNASYSGGTTGFVGSALRVQTDVQTASSVSTFEWAGLFILNNMVPANNSGGGPGSGAVPQQVALYGQANKNSTSATWAGCFEINDNYYDGTVANGPSIGIEITVRSVGSDSVTMSRVGMHVAAHTPETSIGAEWGTAYYATSDASKKVRFRYGLRVDGLIGDSLIYNTAGSDQASSALVRDAGSLNVGIDVSLASYTSNIALRMKNGMRISFDATDTNQIYGSTSGIVTKGVLKMNSSFAIPSSGNISTSATAGGVASLPPTVAGFVNFDVDGVVKKIPFYN